MTLASSDLLDVLKAAAALLVSLGGVAAAIAGWAKIAAGFGERRAQLKAEIDKKATRVEVDAIKDGLEHEIRVVREENRSENVQQMERIFLLTSKVEALHKRVDANVSALESQGVDLRRNTEATLRTEATTEATREMLRLLLERIPGEGKDDTR